MIRTNKGRKKEVNDVFRDKEKEEKGNNVVSFEKLSNVSIENIIIASKFDHLVKSLTMQMFL